MAYQNILVQDKNHIRYITINRESKMNALNRATLAELHAALSEGLDDKSVGGMIITGAGSKAFVAGADISELEGMDAYAGRAMALAGQQNVFSYIADCSKPVIAAINGYALGGGLELALSCHIRVASDNAKMGLPEVTLGLIPGYGGTQRLTALVGKGKALEMILTADMITADEAYRIGLVNYVTGPADLLTKAEELMNKILQRSPTAVAKAITAVNAAGTPDGYETEIKMFESCFYTADFKEGTAAFNEKRKPVFKGE